MTVVVTGSFRTHDGGAGLVARRVHEVAARATMNMDIDKCAMGFL
jgi:hypothetical protein